MIKKIAKILFLMCTSVLCTGPIHGEDLRPASGLIVHIDTEKDTFLVREPIWISVEARNVSNRTMRCSFPMSPRLFTLRDSEGEVLRWKRGSGFCAGFSVEPGKPVPSGCGLRPGGVQDVLTCFGTFDGDRAIIRRYLDPGTYSLTGHCSSGTGTVASNEICFTVIVPEGHEKRACELLKMSYESETDTEEMRCLAEVIEEHRNSVYVPVAINASIMRNWSSSGYDEMVLLIDRMVAGYPDSPFIEYAVRFLPPAYEKIGKHSKEDVRIKLNSIIERHKGTRAENAALAAIDRMKKESME